MGSIRGYFAGVEGVGPSLAVLETAVLPLNDTPIFRNNRSVASFAYL